MFALPLFFRPYLDAWQTNNWAGVTGDIAKLGLGVLSIFFDIIFFVQHYFMYTDRQDVSRPETMANASTDSASSGVDSGMLVEGAIRASGSTANGSASMGLGERLPLIDGSKPNAGSATYS